MAGSRELNLDSMRIYMLEKGGKVTNHELVKYFKSALTREDTKAEAKQKFKEYVNVLANIKTDDVTGEKCLMLKRVYYPQEFVPYQQSPLSSPSPSVTGSMLSLSQESLLDSPSRVPPPYRPPPPPGMSPRSSPQQQTPPPPSLVRHVEGQESDTPPVPPRRRSSDKGNKENLAVVDLSKRPKTEGEEAQQETKKDGDAPEPKISVKERTQKFNRLASESDLKLLPNLQSSSKKKPDKNGSEYEESGPMDARAHDWMISSSKGDYQTLAKLVAERPNLAYFKEPCWGYNALHWAAKYGNADIVKLIAGSCKIDPNIKTRMGMTPLHIAMQFGHEEVYQLLVQVYNADPNIRDYSGKKPRQYQVSQDTSVSADTFRKIKLKKKHSDKDLGFLRIGSLNVRVKKTTEAFSNFFVGGNNTIDRLHKSWGSADNIQEFDRRTMPPPKTGVGSRRRRARRSPSSIQLMTTTSSPLISSPLSASTACVVSSEPTTSQSTPSTPHQPRAHPNDSDSDNACGFGETWKNTV